MGNRALCNLSCALPLTIAGFIGLAGNNSVFAQLNPDNTLGAENSTVTVEQLRDLIRGGAIRGNALFHSFEEFNVGEGREVIFDLQNNTDILNIFTRVTGGNISEILGVLGALKDASSFTGSLGDLNAVTFGDSRTSPIEPALGNVNLFLLNPNGIIFGEGARLRINGSFLATTADGFGFDNFTFSASGEEAPPPLLTISIPRFLSFRDNPAPITNFSNSGGGLRVPNRLTLGLIGGEVQYLTGASRTRGGRIEVGAEGSNATVNVVETDTGYRLNYEGVETFGDITLEKEFPESDVGRSNINVDGAFDSGDSGSLQLQGRNITLSDGSVVRSNSRGSLTPGEVVINASGRLTIQGAPRGSQNEIRQSSIEAGVDVDFDDDSDEISIPGSGANITINTRELLIRDGGVIDILAGRFIGDQPQLRGVADSGDITINATDFVRIIGDSGDIEQRERFPESDEARSNTIASRAFSGTTGNAGNITINTEQFILENGAQVSTSNAGSGNVGNITINTEQFTLEDGAQVSASNSGSGNAGNIFLNASDLVLLRNGSSISAESAGFGDGANININTSFVVAFPEENSDIIAISFSRGGSITIGATQIYGFQSLGEFTPLSDIVATAEVGVFGIQTSTPIEIIEFPEAVLQTPDIVTQSACYDFGGDSQLSNTGRGGIPQIPGLVVRNSVVNVDLVDEV